MVALSHTFSQRFWLAHLSHICWCVIRDWGKEHDGQRVLGSGLLLSALCSLFSALCSLHSAPCSLLSAPSHCLRPVHLPSQGLGPVSGYHSQNSLAIPDCLHPRSHFEFDVMSAALEVVVLGRPIWQLRSSVSLTPPQHPTLSLAHPLCVLTSPSTRAAELFEFSV
jgi:hypothetical protein